MCVAFANTREGDGFQERRVINTFDSSLFLEILGIIAVTRTFLWLLWLLEDFGNTFHHSDIFCHANSPTSQASVDPHKADVSVDCTWPHSSALLGP
jgi:hypothetical protein